MVDGKSALIIANSHYQDPDLRQLVAPAYDAQALARVLGNAAIGGFEVKTLLDKPAQEVSQEIEKFFLNRRRGDLLLLYFSGHGIKDDDGLLYFATTDTHLIEHGRPLRSSAVSAEFVKDVMRCSKSRRQVLMLDCCYSGAFAGALMAKGDKSVGIKERFAEGRGMVVITASDALQYSFEGDKVEGQGQRSVFTRTMVEGIESGKADLNHDGEISLDELYEYVYEHVSDQTPEQRPRKWDLDIEGKIFLAHSPTLTPADLPPELLEAIANPLARVRFGAIEELGALLRGSHKGLALAARQALIDLKDDDSRRIATAAEDLLSQPPPALPSVLPPAIETAQPPPLTESPQPVAAASANAFDVKPVSGKKVLQEVEVPPVEIPQPASAQPITLESERAQAVLPVPKEPTAEQVAATPAQPQISAIRSFLKSWKVLVPLGVVAVLLFVIFFPDHPATKPGPEPTPTPTLAPAASSPPETISYPELKEKEPAKSPILPAATLPAPSSAASSEGGIYAPAPTTLSDPKNRAQISPKDLASQLSQGFQQQPTEAGVRAILEKFIDPNTDKQMLMQRLRPSSEDYRIVYRQPFASTLESQQRSFIWDSKETLAAEPGQTEIKIVFANTDDLIRRAPISREFPGGYNDVRQYLNPGIPIVRFEYVPPSKSSSVHMSYDGLLFVRGRWVFIPKPWQALNK